VASNDTQNTGLAGRYATAVFDLALEERGLEALSADLAHLRTLLDKSADFLRLVRSPVLTREQQTAALEAILKQAHGHPLTRKLILLLTQKRRLFILADVIRAFEGLVAKHRGEIAAEVTSAHPLNDDEFAALKRTLKEKLGREPNINAHVDPALLGGMRLKIGSRMIDSSLRTKLDQLRAAMRGGS
jgi:F-type H+-transporting ATPase subunit delta